MPNLLAPLLPLFALLIVVAVVVTIIKALAAGTKAPKEFPYESEGKLFTPAETRFLAVLEQALEGRYRVFGKVRLADVIKVKKGLDRKKWQSAFNMIQSKHLDYVVCDPDDLSIQFAVELDDKSHEKPKRRDRCVFRSNRPGIPGLDRPPVGA